MDQFIGAVALAAITGLTYVAYKHPTAYKILALRLIVSVLVWELAGFIWNVAVDVTLHSLAPQLKNYDQARTLANGIKIAEWLAYLVPLLTAFYLMFLSYLPRLLAEEK